MKSPRRDGPYGSLTCIGAAARLRVWSDIIVLLPRSVEAHRRTLGSSPHDTDDDRYTTTGRPLWQAEIKIVEAGSGLTVSNGEEGEICARGYQLMLGYFDMPDETRQTIDAEGW